MSIGDRVKDTQRRGLRTHVENVGERLFCYALISGKNPEVDQERSE